MWTRTWLAKRQVSVHIRRSEDQQAAPGTEWKELRSCSLRDYWFSVITRGATGGIRSHKKSHRPKTFNDCSDKTKKLVKSFFEAPECKYVIDHYNKFTDDLKSLRAAGEW